MKQFLIAFVILCCAQSLFAQTPQNITASRWILPGYPRISDLVSVADGKATKTVWFTARDSFGIGTMTVPKTCVPGSYTEYKVPNIGTGPSHIAYAEKAFQVQDTAKKKPAKYKPQVWYIDGYQAASGNAYNGTSNLYALTPPVAKGGPMGLLLYQMPNIPVNVAFSVGTPLSLQWTAATKTFPSSLWFMGFNQYPSAAVDLYSFTPQKKPTAAYGASVTKYSFTNVNESLTAAHVENGLIWTVGTDGSNQTWLNMVPAGGSGNGLRWSIYPNPNPTAPPQILPVYTSRKSAPGVMPNQVWIRYQATLFVIGMAASTTDSMVVDTVWFGTNPNPIRLYMGLGACNIAKADTGKNVVAFTENPPTSGGSWTMDVSFLKAGIQGFGGFIRHGITISTQSEVISAIAIPNVPSYTATVQPSCLSGATTYGTAFPWLRSEWDFSYTGFFQNVTAPLFTSIIPVGYMDTKKFDLVFAQTGGDQMIAPNPTDATISRMVGTFSKPAKSATAASAELDEQPATDKEEVDSDVAESTEPVEFRLFDAYPNPFNPSTTIQFSLPAAAHVSLKIFNTLGQEVATLVDEDRQQGMYSVEWNARGVASGVYFYRLIAGQNTASKMIMLAK